MKIKNLILFSLLILLTFPLISKRKGESIQTFIEKNRIEKKKVSFLNIVKKDKILALNYIKVRERILKSKKNRKFHMIFRASVKHILEEKGSINSPFNENAAIAFSNYFNYKWDGTTSYAGIILKGFESEGVKSNFEVANIVGQRGKMDNFLSFNTDFNFNFIKLSFEGAKSFRFDDKFLGSSVSVDLKNFKANFYLWKGSGFAVQKNFSFYGDELPLAGEHFSVGQGLKNYYFELSQNLYLLKFYRVNSLSFRIRNKNKFFESSVGAGLISAVFRENYFENYYFFNIFFKKRFFNESISVEIPYVFNLKKNYIDFLTFSYSPSIKLFAFVPKISSELFVGVYYNLFNLERRVLYQFGLRKYYNL